VLNEAKTDDNLANLYFKYYHRNSIAFEKELENENKLNITTKRDLLESTKFLDPFPSIYF
jgi:flagellar basal body rod protein FlgB